MTRDTFKAKGVPMWVEGITDEEIAEWEAERGNGMVSCVGEYTPDEFWRVLDELKRLRALTQQPAYDGGFTAADMMDARQEGRQEAQQPTAEQGGTK